MVGMVGAKLSCFQIRIHTDQAAKITLHTSKKTRRVEARWNSGRDVDNTLVFVVGGYYVSRSPSRHFL